MSFALTTRQVRAREKTVTRRNGWRRARVGQVVQPIVKGQGLRKGEHVETIGGPIRFVDVRRERLDAITPEDVHREGFPGRSSKWFVAMYLEANGGRRDQIVTRIEFEYLDPVAAAYEDIVRAGVLEDRREYDAEDLRRAYALSEADAAALYQRIQHGD